MATQPWERQPGETTKAWEAFKTFRDMPPADRSVLGAYKLSAESAEKARKGPITAAPHGWKDWAIENDWKQRAAAYDRDQERRRRQERDRIHAAETKRFQANLRRDAENFEQAARAAMTKTLGGLKKKDMDEEPMSFTEIASMFRSIALLHQQARETHFVGLGLDDLMMTLEDTPMSDAPDTDEPEE